MRHPELTSAHLENVLHLSPSRRSTDDDDDDGPLHHERQQPQNRTDDVSREVQGGGGYYQPLTDASTQQDIVRQLATPFRPEQNSLSTERIALLQEEDQGYDDASNMARHHATRVAPPSPYISVATMNNVDTAHSWLRTPTPIPVLSNADHRISLVASLHSALRNGEYDRLPEFVQLASDTTVGGSSNSSNRTWFWWQPNPSSGWTAVHLAVSQFVPEEWLEWILYQATTNMRLFQREEYPYGRLSTAPSSCCMQETGVYADFRAPVLGDDLDFVEDVFSCPNALGETALDIFFRTNLDPFPWQGEAIRVRSRQLQEALEEILPSSRTQSDTGRKDSNGSSHLQALRSYIEHDGAAVIENSRSGRSTASHRLQSRADPLAFRRSVSTPIRTRAPQHVHRVRRFWNALELLCRVSAVGRTVIGTIDARHDAIVPSTSLGRTEQQPPQQGAARLTPAQVLSCLAASGCAIPCQIPLLVLALDPHAARTTTSTTVLVYGQQQHQQRLPLHQWAACRPSTSCCAAEIECSHNMNENGRDRSLQITSEWNPQPINDRSLRTGDDMTFVLEKSTGWPSNFLQQLVDANRDAACLPDPLSGQWPLAMAIRHGHSWQAIQPLLRIETDVLLHTDPLFHLPPFCWAAIAASATNCEPSISSQAVSSATSGLWMRTANTITPIHQSNALMSTSTNVHAAPYRWDPVPFLGRRRVAGAKDLIAMWHLLRPDAQQQALDEARDQWHRWQLNTIFQLFLAAPQALSCARL